MSYQRAARTTGSEDVSTGSAPSPGKATLTSRNTARSSALPDDLRARFETSLGEDLSGVRVHTDDAAASGAASVGARAYAFGQDIHFGAGEYRPGTSDGDVLIAHEVAHTVQQRGGAAAPQYKLAMSTPGDRAEREADAAAAQMVTGAPAHVSSSGVSIMREVNQSAAPAMSSDKDHMASLLAEASSIADQLGKNPAAATLQAARGALDGCKEQTVELAGIYGLAQNEVIKEEIAKQEVLVAQQKEIHDLVKKGVGKALELVIPGATIAKAAEEKLGGLAGKAVGFLADKAIGKGIDAASDKITDKLVGEVPKVSDVVLPKNKLLVDIASAKELWAMSGQLDRIYDTLLQAHPKATVLVKDIIANAAAIEDHGTVPTLSAQGTLVKQAPKSASEVEALVQRLRDAKGTIDQAAASAAALLGAIEAMSADLTAIAAITDDAYAKQQIRSSSGIGGLEAPSSMGAVDVTDVMKVWNRMIGETVTATTDCKPEGKVVPAYYPPKAVDGAPDQPVVHAQVGDGLGELAVGGKARIIAIVSVTFYSVTVLVHPLPAETEAAPPAYNGETCDETMTTN